MSMHISCFIPWFPGQQYNIGHNMPVGKGVLHALESKEVVTTEHGWRGSRVG